MLKLYIFYASGLLLCYGSCTIKLWLHTTGMFMGLTHYTWYQDYLHVITVCPGHLFLKKIPMIWLSRFRLLPLLLLNLPFQSARPTLSYGVAQDQSHAKDLHVK